MGLSWSGDGWSGDYHVDSLFTLFTMFIQVTDFWSGDLRKLFGAEIGRRWSRDR